MKISLDLEQALLDLKNAVEFFDKVQASSEEEKIAVGHDHWDWLISAAKAVTAEVKS
jgi:hypothetical protein